MEYKVTRRLECLRLAAAAAVLLILLTPSCSCDGRGGGGAGADDVYVSLARRARALPSGVSHVPREQSIHRSMMNFMARLPNGSGKHVDADAIRGMFMRHHRALPVIGSETPLFTDSLRNFIAVLPNQGAGLDQESLRDMFERHYKRYNRNSNA